MNNRLLEPIAYIYTDFNDKFGIPRQSGRCPSLIGKIVFTPKYRVPEALTAIEQFNYLWLIFDFTLSHREDFSPTVRPPRLGGNKKVGVFASRSPFRPNNLGLSSVKLEKTDKNDTDGTFLIVSGVDILNGTPIYDIKPYIPYADCHPDATEGYTKDTKKHLLNVDFPFDLLKIIEECKREAVIDCLADDPRTAYSEDGKVFKMRFGKYDVEFFVTGDTLTVTNVRLL